MVSSEVVVEWFVLVLFVFALYFAYRIKKLDFLIYGSLFAFFFEHVGVLLSGGSGYYYSEAFSLYLFRVPLFVVLSWGILLLGAHLVSLKLRMSKVSRVFFVAFFVTLVDFVIEGVSVDLGYWVWEGVVGGGNIFSYIFAPNFIGWMGVSFGFILCWEYLPKNYRWLSSFLGYLALVFLGLFSFVLSWALGEAGEDGYISLIFIFILFFGAWICFYHRNHILKKNRGDFKVDFLYGKYVVWMRGFFYLFGLVFIVWRGHYNDFVYVLVVGFVFLLELHFFLRFNGYLRKVV